MLACFELALDPELYGEAVAFELDAFGERAAFDLFAVLPLTFELRDDRFDVLILFAPITVAAPTALRGALETVLAELPDVPVEP